MNFILPCPVCQEHKTLELLYIPETSPLNLGIYICQDCGLFQSLPRIKKDDPQRKSTSNGADFGNLRYGKGFRAKAAVDTLKGHKNLRSGHVLDVGANRGAFIEAFLRESQSRHITALEPHAELFPDELRQNKRVSFVHAGIDTPGLSFEPGSFAIIHCSHTLEHLFEPVQALKKMREWTMPGGVMYLEVPNTAIISQPDFVEEFFIDKHLYHFTHATLTNALNVSGWTILDSWDTGENLAMLCTPGQAKEIVNFYDKAKLVTDYANDLPNRKAFLERQVIRINTLAYQSSTVIWGAGRIFSALVEAGLDRDAIGNVVIDSYLQLPEVHGCKVLRSDKLMWGNIENVVVCSREYFDEIAQSVLKHNPEMKVRQWDKVE